MVNSVSGARISGNNNVITVHKKTVNDGRNGVILGAAIGAVEGYSRKNWLNKDGPTDTFIKGVSKGLENALKPEDKEEVTKLKDFFAAVMEPTTDLTTLRPTIEDSSELIGAVPVKDNETTSQALDRIFDDKNVDDLKPTLRDMQNSTKIDKTVDIHAAKRLLHDNITSDSKEIKQSEKTSDRMFGIIKKAAKKIKVKTAIGHAIIGSIILGTIGLLLGATSYKQVEPSKK